MDIKQAKYMVIRFVPDLVKNEPINIGLILHCWNEYYIRSEISKEKAKLIEKYNPQIKKSILQALIEDIDNLFSSEKWLLKENSSEDFKNEKYLDNYLLTHSNQLQFTNPKGIITQDLESEFEELFTELVYYKCNTKTRSKYTSEMHMKSYLKKLFNERNLLKEKLIVENYKEEGKYGEKIEFDFKYLNGTVNLVNNLSFDVKAKDPLEYAKLWAKNYEDIKNISKKNNETRKIRTIFAVSDECENKNSIEDCLKEYSDEIINYNDKEYLQHFTDRICETAHI